MQRKNSRVQQDNVQFKPINNKINYFESIYTGKFMKLEMNLRFNQISLKDIIVKRMTN